MELKEAVCVITGAAQGIGLALARQMSERGANVILSDARDDALREAMEGFDPDHTVAVSGDVRSQREVQHIAETALQRFGKLDVWVNNAGLARHKAIVDYREEEMDLMMDVNLKGAVFGCQAALRAMIPNRQGHIVNVISTAALRGIPTESFYCATKWALRGFTQALQEEAAPHGIRATAILPGGVNTAFWDEAVDREMPVSEFLTADQVAGAIIQVLEQDDFCVTRELVVRSLMDRDFAQ